MKIKKKTTKIKKVLNIRLKLKKQNCAMKLNEPVGGSSPVVTPLKISSVLGQKLSKVEPTTTTTTSHTQKKDELDAGNGSTAGAGNDEDYDNSPDEDDEEDSTKEDDVALTGFVKESGQKDIKQMQVDRNEEVGGGGGVSVVADMNTGGGGGVDNDTAETEEESTIGVGKKKGVRKKRSINWEEAERVSITNRNKRIF